MIPATFEPKSTSGLLALAERGREDHAGEEDRDEDDQRSDVIVRTVGASERNTFIGTSALTSSADDQQHVVRPAASAA